ncbi:MAG: glycosyltransferase family 4 protein [Proteobacteria bacterium]|nr:glycosyltransferase family 4 protein [Pseudomonadota bacterium]MBU1736848.1 glycosyltransferase family 4 protein [Pseudomonadota bacterium]
MKILFANKFFYQNGGSERVFFQEREFLTGNGVEVIDFSMRDPRNLESPYSEYFVDNVNYESAGGLTGKLKTAGAFVHSAEAVAKLTALLEQERPDIAHLHNIYHQLTPSIIPVLKKHRVKVVLTLHDYKLICPSYLALCGDEICTACNGRFFWNPFTRNCQGSRSRGLLLAGEALFHKFRKSYEGVDLFLAPSRFLADLVGRRVEKDQIRVLRNGIDINAFQPNYADRGYALYFGRLSKEKGVETLLAAGMTGATKFPLKIVGTGPLLESLKVRFPKTEFLGYKTGEELVELIKNAAFVVVPSEWYENCSMVVLEAMALGKPVIGCDIGGIPEQIDDGKTGLLFPMGNSRILARKMHALAIDKNLRISMGSNARKKLEASYSLAAHCNKLMDIYSDLGS